jgi:hypothetical protein
LIFTGEVTPPTADNDFDSIVHRLNKSRVARIVDLMPQVGNAEKSSQSNMKAVAAHTETPSSSQNGKTKTSGVAKPATTTDVVQVPKTVKQLAEALATTIAQQRTLLTKKPEGIQISRSKHWKFISSYHGPCVSFSIALIVDGSNYLRNY